MQLQIMKTTWYLKKKSLKTNEFHFYFCSLQWPYFHVCNPQIVCLKKNKQKTPKPNNKQKNPKPQAHSTPSDWAAVWVLHICG